MKTTSVAIELQAAFRKLSDQEYPDDIQQRVMDLTGLMGASGMSPVQCALVLARTAAAAAAGAGMAIATSGLHPTEISDRDVLGHVVVALRAAADVNEAILRAGSA